MKILILGKNRIEMHNWGHELWKQEIARQHDVRFYGTGYGKSAVLQTSMECGHGKTWGDTSIHRIIDELEFEPDLIYTHLGKDVSKKIGLGKINIPKVHFTTDYYYWTYQKENSFINKCKPDLVLLTNNSAIERMRLQLGRDAKLLPLSVDTNVFKPQGTDRQISVSAIMSAHKWYYQREDILKHLAEIEGSYILKSVPTRRKLHDEYVGLCAGSKIGVNGTRFYLKGYGDKRHNRFDPTEEYFTFLPWKVMEIPACGALLLTQYDDTLSDVGFSHLDNCVIFDNPREIPLIVNDLLERDERRQEIAAAGLRHVTEHHSNEVRVRQFTEIVQRELGINDDKELVSK